MSVRPLTSGTIGLDIINIYNNADLHPNALNYKATLHTVDSSIDIMELISVEISKDYANNITDYILVTFTLPLGDYIKLIHPFKDNLELVLTLNYYDTTYPERYKFVIVKSIDNVAGNAYSSYSREELNKLDKVIVEGQCLSRLVEAVRHTPVDGVYNYVTVKDLIRSVMLKEISEVKVEDSEVETKFNFVPPNNEKIFRHINVPFGVTLLDLPSYIQNSDYGVYNTDIGTYVQKYGYFKEDSDPIETIFVYPLYHNKLTDNPGKKLLILSSPLEKLKYNNKSYYEDGDIIKIVGHGDMMSKEVSQANLINNGNSVITTSPDSVMMDAVTVTDDVAITAKDVNISGTEVKEKTDTVKLANYIKPTSNPYKVLSVKSRDLLSPFQITWNFSNPYLLYPGMPVSYLYEDSDNGVIKLSGIIHSHYTKYHHSSKTHVTVLNVLLEPYVDKLGSGDDVIDIT